MRRFQHAFVSGSMRQLVSRKSRKPRNQSKPRKPRSQRGNDCVTHATFSPSDFIHKGRLGQLPPEAQAVFNARFGELAIA